MNEQLEQQRQQALDYVADQTKYAFYLNDSKNPSKLECQLGQPLTSVAFEQRLKKLNPNLLSEIHPQKSDKKCLYLVDSRGKQFICAYENGFMPEFSVWRTKVEEVWDGTTHITKADLPKGEIINGEWVWETDKRPGYKYVEVPYGEAIRGWRTVLLKVIGNFINTPAEVERIFGTCDAMSWAAHTKKRNIAMPF